MLGWHSRQGVELLGDYIYYTPELSIYWYIYVQCSALGPKYFSAHTTGTTAAIKAMLELTPVDAGHTTSNVCMIN